jgi:hypothetical protein
MTQHTDGYMYGYTTGSNGLFSRRSSPIYQPYGTQLNIVTKCPKCSQLSEYNYYSRNWLSIFGIPIFPVEISVWSRCSKDDLCYGTNIDHSIQNAIEKTIGPINYGFPPSYPLDYWASKKGAIISCIVGSIIGLLSGIVLFSCILSLKLSLIGILLVSFVTLIGWIIGGIYCRNKSIDVPTRNERIDRNRH